jgi:UDPglucose--hexose-1-phosphate uridylyltransferase
MSSIQDPASSIQHPFMPELRSDWLTGRTVLIAEHRANRPNEFETHSLSPTYEVGEAASAAVRTRATASCPFCPGNEADTPPAHYEQLDEQDRWRVRVIPNKYPAVTEFAEAPSPFGRGHGEGALSFIESPSPQASPRGTGSHVAFGVHEVIVETARHVDRTSMLSETELRYVLEAYAARLRHWSADGRFAYGLVFKNQGPRAGATIAHLHSQLFALPAIPSAVDAELSRARVSHAEHRSCVYCRLIQEEREAAARIVQDRDGYFVFCPFASLQPCEVWVMPTIHESSFERAMSRDSLDRLSGVLHKLVAAIESLFPSASFNWLIRTAPWKGESATCFHWRIEILPRLNAIAGLESATGIFVNPAAPERAAAELRRNL